MQPWAHRLWSAVGKSTEELARQLRQHAVPSAVRDALHAAIPYLAPNDTLAQRLHQLPPHLHPHVCRSVCICDDATHELVLQVSAASSSVGRREDSCIFDNVAAALPEVHGLRAMHLRVAGAFARSPSALRAMLRLARCARAQPRAVQVASLELAAGTGQPQAKRAAQLVAQMVLLAAPTLRALAFDAYFLTSANCQLTAHLPACTALQQLRLLASNVACGWQAVDVPLPPLLAALPHLTHLDLSCTPLPSAGAAIDALADLPRTLPQLRAIGLEIRCAHIVTVQIPLMTALHSIALIRQATTLLHPSMSMEESHLHCKLSLARLAYTLIKPEDDASGWDTTFGGRLRNLELRDESQGACAPLSLVQLCCALRNVTGLTRLLLDMPTLRISRVRWHVAAALPKLQLLAEVELGDALASCPDDSDDSMDDNGDNDLDDECPTCKALGIALGKPPALQRVRCGHGVLQMFGMLHLSVCLYGGQLTALQELRVNFGNTLRPVFDLFARSLSSLQTLHELCISDAESEHASVAALALALVRNSGLTQLQVLHAGMGVADASLLAPALATLTALRVCDLSGNDLGAIGMRAVLAKLACLPSLTSLKLVACGCSVNDVSRFKEQQCSCEVVV